MPRACTKCVRVVAEAAYCPFCSSPTIEYIPVPVKRSDARTIRTLFEQRNRWITTVSSISFLVIQAGWFTFLIISQEVGRAYPFFIPFIVAAMFIFCVAAVITLVYGRSYAFPCPRCEKNIDLPAIRGNVRYCPFCGIDLDIEIDPETHEPKQFLNKEWRQRELEIKNTDIQLPPGNQKANTGIQLPHGKAE